MMSQKKIMVADDDENILFVFREVLQREGFTTIEARNGHEALEKFVLEEPHTVFMDITMPGLSGLETLRRIKQQNQSVPVIIITGQGTMQTAISAMQLGAFEYLTKPLSLVKVREVMHRALRLSDSPPVQRIRFDADIQDRYELVGDSVPMQEIYKLIGSVSTTPNHTSVLVTGESGTGKELVARAIHNNTTLSGSHPFVAINCAAFPETLLESELFGHEKGTYTGATDRLLGRFEVARAGTLFLDEIGDLAPNLQLKLLRVLQEREFERLGGNNTISVDARFIAATNQDIATKVKTGAIREDLFYRLNVVTIHMPPLREHKEDIPLLAHYFLERYAVQLKKPIEGFTDEAMELLQSYSYPGNVRELGNLIERAVMLTKGGTVLPDALGEGFLSASVSTAPLPIISPFFDESREHVLNMFEKQFIVEQLAKYRGNISAAAKASKMSRQNFHRLLFKHKLQQGTDDVDQ